MLKHWLGLFAGATLDLSAGAAPTVEMTTSQGRFVLELFP